MPHPVTYVIIATKGRAEAVLRLLERMEWQTVHPTRIILSACEATDVPVVTTMIPTQIVLGPPGLAAQRNRALSVLPVDTDYIVFFDDDFVPSCLWIERMQAFFAMRPDAVALTGRVLADGVKSGGIDWAEGLSMIERVDHDAKPITGERFSARSGKSPYGCNMAYRFKMIKGLTFDERLVLYGWLEDRDFGFRATKGKGAAFWTDALWGVHLGIKGARVSGASFGYSQVVNPWYLFNKGVATSLKTGSYIVHAIATNAIMCLIRNNHVDRFGRLKGNLLGIADIIRGSWRPERAAEI